MKLPLSARIAWRYLRAKKSHSAVGAISVNVRKACGVAEEKKFIAIVFKRRAQANTFIFVGTVFMKSGDINVAYRVIRL